MRSAASMLGVWLTAVAPMCLSATSTWARGCLAGHMLPWVALVWVAWSGAPIRARGAPFEHRFLAASDMVWIALPVLSAACALDIASGGGVASTITTLAITVAWIWMLGSAASRVATDGRAERIYASTWFVALPGAFVLARTIAWSGAGSHGDAPRWLASLASLSPVAWIAERLAGSRAAGSIGSNDAPLGTGSSSLAASCAVVLALWALAWWLTRRPSSTEPPLEGSP